MKVRFQADADLNQVILAAALRRAPELEFRTSLLAGLQGLDDLQVLGLAARDGRVLVTHDSKTMPRHFAQFVLSQSSAGVIVDDIVLIWAATAAEEWTNRICYVPL